MALERGGTPDNPTPAIPQPDQTDPDQTDETNKKDDSSLESPIAPCKYMEGAINSLSDDTLRGPLRWYTQLHASRCKHCGPALHALRRLRLRMSVLKRRSSSEPTTLSSERKRTLSMAMEAIDNTSLNEERR